MAIATPSYKMIERINKKHLLGLSEFIKKNPNPDFYYTENNTRKYFSGNGDLKKLLKIFSFNYCYEKSGDILGIISIWKSFGNNIARHFIKLNAINRKIASDLLIVLLWNTPKDLYIKIKKDSPLINIFEQKGFRFLGDRGREILLYRKYIFKEKNNEQHKEQNKISVK